MYDELPCERARVRVQVGATQHDALIAMTLHVGRKSLHDGVVATRQLGAGDQGVGVFGQVAVADGSMTHDALVAHITLAMGGDPITIG